MKGSDSVIKRVAGDIIRRAARRYPDKIAVIDGETRISYRTLDETCNRFACFLLNQGLRKGDRVACVCQNSVEFLLVIYGFTKAGLVWVPINPFLAPKDIEYIVNHWGSAGIRVKMGHSVDSISIL